MPGAGAAGGGDAERADRFVAPDAPRTAEAARVSVLGSPRAVREGGGGDAVLGGVGLDCELLAFAGRAAHGFPPLGLRLLRYI